MTAAAPGTRRRARCGRAVLLYDSGRVLHGRIAEMLMQDKLKTLYRYRPEPAGGSDLQVSLPVD